MRKAVGAFLISACLGWAAVKVIAFSQSAASVAIYDVVEVMLRASAPSTGNPFTDAVVTGEFRESASQASTKVDGFCDSEDGRIFRVRFMPSKPGDYVYTIKYAEKGFDKSYEGTFRAVASG